MASTEPPAGPVPSASTENALALVELFPAWLVAVSDWEPGDGLAPLADQA